MVTTHRPQHHVGLDNPGTRLMFGALLVIHGIAHLVGTTTAVAAVADDTTIEYLAGEWTISDSTQLTILGVLWASVAAGFAAAALATWTLRTYAARLVGIVAAVSLVMCLVGLWATAIGVVVNVGLLIAIRQPSLVRRITP